MSTNSSEMALDRLLNGVARRLYVLDYGLFRVHENGRVIGIQGYLIEAGDGRHILVDAGFPEWYAIDPDGASVEDDLGSFGEVLALTADNLPRAQLARAGLTPEAVDLFVLSHGDIDHVGGLADFTHAPIVVGRAERALARPRYFGERRPLPWPAEARYELIDGDAPLAPGVAVLGTPGHSPGHLSLLLRLPRTGPVVLTIDALSRPAELEADFADADDPAAARASANRLMRAAGRMGAFIIYGHDPVQWPTLRKAPEYYD